MDKGDVFWENYTRRKFHVHYSDDVVTVFKWWRKHKMRWEWEAEETWLVNHSLSQGMYVDN